MDPTGETPPDKPVPQDPWGPANRNPADGEALEDHLPPTTSAEQESVVAPDAAVSSGVTPEASKPPEEEAASEPGPATGVAAATSAPDEVGSDVRPSDVENEPNSPAATTPAKDRESRPQRPPREPKKPGPLARAMSALPRPVRLLLQAVGTIIGLGLAGLFGLAWFDSTEDLTFSAGEASPAVSPGTVTLTYVDDLDCVPEPNTIFEPTAFGRWQLAYRLEEGEWVKRQRNFWDGETASLDSDAACGDDRTLEVPLPEGLPERVALCRLNNGCVEVTLG